MWPWPEASKVAGKYTFRYPLLEPKNLGDRRVLRSERYGGPESGLLRPRPERVDELEHVLREFTRAVGAGRAFDQFPALVTVVELEAVVDPNRFTTRSTRTAGGVRSSDLRVAAATTIS